jgi:hypothetical protein
MRYDAGNAWKDQGNWGGLTRYHETRWNVGCVTMKVVYPVSTDNSSGGQSGKIVSFHHPERGRRHGTEPTVLPTSAGRSRVDLYAGPCLVA